MIVIRFLQFLFALLVVRLVSRMLGAFFRQQQQQRPAARPRAGAPRSVSGGELVKDRVCNTHVPRERALVARIGGRDEYFCSAGCRDRALAAMSRAS
jgi:hypothetical protein